jgi:broad specificity phosphatase PhoE
MRIYIRHSDKLYKNGDRGHDPPLTTKGRAKVEPLGRALVERYGVPLIIISSPFLRCRETSELLHRAIYEKTGKRVGIKCDREISEYLGNHADKPLMVNEITQLYNPPHPETFYDMEDRVHKHNDKMRDLDHDPRPVWIVTHGLIMNRLIAFMGFKPLKEISTLTFIVFHQRRGDKPRGWVGSGKRCRRLKR